MIRAIRKSLTILAGATLAAVALTVGA